MFKKKIIFFILVFQLSIIELEARDYLIVQSTTSANNSGIIDVIEKSFEEKYEIDLRFVSVGSGQAIKNGKNGDGDLLFVHSKDDEINLPDSSISKKELRDKIMRLAFEKKYLTACRFCNGRDYATTNITAAVQTRSKLDYKFQN